MTGPRFPGTPTPPLFGGYFTLNYASGDGDVYAWWYSGHIARLDIREAGHFVPVTSGPDFAAIFPPAAPVADLPAEMIGAWVGSGESWVCACDPDRCRRSPSTARCAICGVTRPEPRSL